MIGGHRNSPEPKRRRGCRGSKISLAIVLPGGFVDRSEFTRMVLVARPADHAADLAPHFALILVS
jgi:hypothetical protein